MNESVLSLRLLSSRTLRILLLTATLVVITACTNSASAQQMGIERSTMLEKGRGGRPSAIISTADGGFVIAGNSGTAWATRVTSKGEVLWRYLEALDQSLTPSGQSEFVGAVMLSDDSVLLCGRKILPNHSQVGLLVRLNAKGETLTQQYLYPNDDNQHGFSSFKRCIRWGSGVALVGGFAAQPRAFGWLIKLDALGKKEWERVGADFEATDAIETADHSLVVVTTRLPNKLNLARIDTLGNVQEKRLILCKEVCSAFILFHSINPPSILRVAAIDWPTTTLYELDLSFKDTKAARNIESILPYRGYELPDGSLMVFGNTESRNVYTATIARIDAKGHFVQHIFPPVWSANHLQIEEESTAVYDAIPLSPTEFVSARDWSANTMEHNGMFIDWVSIH